MKGKEVYGNDPDMKKKELKIHSHSNTLLFFHQGRRRGKFYKLDLIFLINFFPFNNLVVSSIRSANILTHNTKIPSINSLLLYMYMSLLRTWVQLALLFCVSERDMTLPLPSFACTPTYNVFVTWLQALSAIKINHFPKNHIAKPAGLGIK